MTEFRLVNIKIDQFAILQEHFPHQDLTLNLEIGTGANKSDRIVVNKLRVNIVKENDLLLTITISCFFEIKPDSWKEWEHDNKVKIPRSFLVHTAIHTLGTMRGIMFCKTEGTLYQQLILPPTNVDSMIDGDLLLN